MCSRELEDESVVFRQCLVERGSSARGRVSENDACPRPGISACLLASNVGVLGSSWPNSCCTPGFLKIQGTGLGAGMQTLRCSLYLSLSLARDPPWKKGLIRTIDSFFGFGH